MTNNSNEEIADGDTPIDTFFWLGDADNAESLTEEDFEERIKAMQEAERKWKNVEVDG